MEPIEGASLDADPYARLRGQIPRGIGGTAEQGPHLWGCDRGADRGASCHRRSLRVSRVRSPEGPLFRRVDAPTSAASTRPGIRGGDPRRRESRRCDDLCISDDLSEAAAWWIGYEINLGQHVPSHLAQAEIHCGALVRTQQTALPAE